MTEPAYPISFSAGSGKLKQEIAENVAVGKMGVEVYCTLDTAYEMRSPSLSFRCLNYDSLR